MSNLPIANCLRSLLAASPLRDEPIPSLGEIAHLDGPSLLRMLNAGRVLAINRTIVEQVVKLLESDGPQ